MKKIICFITIALMGVVAFAQTVTLTFTARDAANQYVQLNRVSVTNLTKDWQETLTWPDTVLTMQNDAGIDESFVNGDFGLSQNNPNPFSGTTDVNLTVAEAGAVTLEIADVLGRIVATHHARTGIGTHQFRVSLSATGTYILTARQNGKTSSIKMVCNGVGNVNRIEYIGAAATTTTAQSHIRRATSNPFSFGDQMEYVGFATINGTEEECHHIKQEQNASETFVLPFSSPCSGTLTVTDVDGNVYNTVMIGTQCWMKENLRTTHYADSTPIPAGESYTFTESYRYAPNNDSVNVDAYGYLYNWTAVMNGEESSRANPSGVQGICPNGWHVPSDAEWTQLADYVSSRSEYTCGGDNSSIAKALAAAEGWSEFGRECRVGNDQSSNNATGFNAVPAGIYNSEYIAFSEAAYFWSATANDLNTVFSRNLAHTTYLFLRDDQYKGRGFSVRCLRD